MRTIIWGNWQRIKHRKSQVGLMWLLTFIALIAANFLGHQEKLADSVLLVNQTGKPISQKISQELGAVATIEEAEEHQLTDFILGKYTTLVNLSETGLIVKEPLKQKESISLGSYLDNKNDQRENSSSDSTNLVKRIGFVMMFLLMSGLTYSLLLGEDKERKLLQKIKTTPISISSYLLGNGLFSLGMLVIPTSLIFILTLCLDSSWLVDQQWLLFLSLICLISLLAISFGMFMMSICPTSDTGNMIGSGILIITTLLAGSFMPVQSESVLFSKFIACLPQKVILTLAENYSRMSLFEIAGSLSWLLVINGLLISLGTRQLVVEQEV